MRFDIIRRDIIIMNTIALTDRNGAGDMSANYSNITQRTYYPSTANATEMTTEATRSYSVVSPTLLFPL